MFVILDDAKIYYEIRGEGKPVILIHHLAGSYKSWSDIAYQLSQKYAVISYDLRGHGRSSLLPYEYKIKDHSKDLKGLIEYLRLDNPIIIGHSLGTLIAIDYALKNPVDKIILSGALYKAPNPEPYENYVSIALNFGMEALAEYRKTIGDFADSLTLNPIAWRKLLEVYNENNPLGYKYAVDGLLHSKDYSRDLPKIYEKTLLIYGSEDKLKQNLNMMLTIPNSNYRILNGYGHFLNFEAPDEMLSLIIDFLERS
ncbi:alpha/beta hydrolase [Acidianus sp. HS-5]|uniref:alpha/beta fold hydrolase n=1 Tax=Acidianus sp. HS-5 TaxID=2886040 RepID=UPI001F2DE195|nr:alpha/beta hydrolase [Acidianus sp. HS-5]BDC19059.1 alpha/beta hydrolase [Acidianus sp. HS-5]